MAKCEKLLEKARRSPNNLGFSDICKLAECYGFIFRRQEGTSHRTYAHPTLPVNMGRVQNFQEVNGKAKPYQVRQLLRAIENLDDE